MHTYLLALKPSSQTIWFKLSVTKHFYGLNATQGFQHVRDVLKWILVNLEPNNNFCFQCPRRTFSCRLFVEVHFIAFKILRRTQEPSLANQINPEVAVISVSVKGKRTWRNIWHHFHVLTYNENISQSFQSWVCILFHFFFFNPNSEVMQDCRLVLFPIVTDRICFKLELLPLL